MIYLALSLVLLGLFAAVVSHFFQRNDSEEPAITQSANCATCSGYDEKCEQECMMEASLKAIEYYDDEELDAFIGRPSDQYTDDEAELFREILTTMLPTDVKGWNRSLILRGINVPDQIKDELLIFLDNS